MEIDIEKHSTIVNDVLGLGRSLLNESDLRSRSLSTIPRTIQTLEQRWTSLKDLIRRRKLE